MPFEAEILLIVFNEATAPAGGGQWRISQTDKMDVDLELEIKQSMM